MKKLVSLPSISGNEHEIADFLAKFLSKLKFDVETISVAGCGPTVLARYVFTDEEPCLLLYGHIDTVEPCKGWSYPPFKPTVIGRRLYGLGSGDMKGGVAAIVAAVSKLSKMKLKGSLLVALASDEELHSKGCNMLIRSGRLKGVDAAISAEPVGLNVMMIGRGGRIVYDVAVRGISRHGAEVNQEDNAVVEASKLVAELKRLPFGRWRGIQGSITVLSMSGGTEFLSTPDSCKMLIDRYIVPGETKKETLTQLQDLVKKLNSKAKFNVRLMKRTTPFPEPYVLRGDSRIIGIVEEACRNVCGVKPKKAFGLSVADDNFLVVKGKIPTVTLGPKGGNEHAPNEYADLFSVVNAAKIYLKSMELYLK
ncbi:MAG: M20/M25/M40 family metallo-hydrolase [Candidatus Bathyarchaeota archaeon]